MYLMLEEERKTKSLCMGGVSGTPWALGKVQQYVTDRQVTGGDDGFTPPAGSDEGYARFHSPPSASTATGCLSPPSLAIPPPI
jgi:hypothetical protein